MVPADRTVQTGNEAGGDGERWRVGLDDSFPCDPTSELSRTAWRRLE